LSREHRNCREAGNGKRETGDTKEAKNPREASLVQAELGLRVRFVAGGRHVARWRDVHLFLVEEVNAAAAEQIEGAQSVLSPLSEVENAFQVARPDRTIVEVIRRGDALEWRYNGHSLDRVPETTGGAVVAVVDFPPCES
jgi:hypothetical protein